MPTPTKSPAKEHQTIQQKGLTDNVLSLFSASELQAAEPDGAGHVNGANLEQSESDYGDGSLVNDQGNFTSYRRSFKTKQETWHPADESSRQHFQAIINPSQETVTHLQERISSKLESERLERNEEQRQFEEWKERKRERERQYTERDENKDQKERLRLAQKWMPKAELQPVPEWYKGPPIIMPVPGYTYLSSPYDPDRLNPVTKVVRAHNAIDLAAPEGTPIHAVADGEIIAAYFDNKGGGYIIKIRHDDGYVSEYLHLHKDEWFDAAQTLVKETEVVPVNRHAKMTHYRV